MAKKKLYKNVVLVEVLSDEPVDISGLSLSQIDYEITEGMWSGRSEVKVANKELKGVRAVAAVLKQGSSPDFFSMDEQGNEHEI